MNSPPAVLPHVYTLTGNLLAERTLEFDHWSPGRTHRAALETIQVGGKGINVSKMLTRLSVANTALFFSGGPTGVGCEAWLRARGIVFRAFATQVSTRMGTVVRDRSGGHGETTFLGPDLSPDAAAVAALAEFIDAQPAGHVLAVCGSVPGWSTDEFAPLRAALQRWATKGVLAVDTYGPPLADLIQHPLSLLKINRDELRSLQIATPADLPRHVEQVVVTDGPRMIHARDRHGVLTSFTPPRVREVSPTGSGDVFLAVLIEALVLRGLPLGDAVAVSIPYAAANAAHPGIAEFPLPPRPGFEQPEIDPLR